MWNGELSKWRRYWPGGGRGGIPLEGIASPGVGRTRLEESQRIGINHPAKQNLSEIFLVFAL